MKKKIKTFSYERKLKEFVDSKPTQKKKKKTNKSFPNRKEMIKEGILEPREGRKNTISKNV